MFVSPQNSYVEILTPKVMILGGGTLGDDKIMRISPNEWDYCPYKIDLRELACPPSTM